MWYLMIKEAKETGLKYLCMTHRRDPMLYHGSGKRWRRHIEKHNPTILTQILGKFETKEELKEAGLYYSNLFNVVESNEWANMTEEKGDGGLIGTGQLGKRWKCSNQAKQNMGYTWRGKNHSEDRKKMTVGEKNWQHKGYYITPWGEYPSITEATKQAKKLKAMGDKLTISDSATLRKYCLQNKIVLNSEGRRTPESWRGKTPSEVGFGFREAKNGSDNN